MKGLWKGSCEVCHSIRGSKKLPTNLVWDRLVLRFDEFDEFDESDEMLHERTLSCMDIELLMASI
jgi:hypothetical protein